MEKAISNNQPNSSQFVMVTPDQLRVIANRLEHESKNTLPGQEIVYALTRTITIIFTPEGKTAQGSIPS